MRGSDANPSAPGRSSGRWTHASLWSRSLRAGLAASAVFFAACSSASDSADPVAASAEGALATLTRIGSWVRFHVGSRGRLRIRASVPPGARATLTITDHYGWPRDRARPRVTVDVDVRDERSGGRSLTGTVHNSERDSNGADPDPFTFATPTSGVVLIDIREVDGFAGDFELRLDVPGVGDDDGGAGASAPAGVVVHRAGETVRDAAPATTAALLLAGGGGDHDRATSALVDAGGRGDAVIVRMDDTGGAYADYFVERGARGATEIVLDPVHGNDDVSDADLAALRARADHPWVARLIDRAEIVFFAGGNQTKYVDAFRGTRLAAAIRRLVARGGALGGTSAGMHLLAGVVHTPRGAGDSVTSAVALADPYVAEDEHPGVKSLAFAESPLAVPLLADVIADTHWSRRARLGRSLVFLARTLADDIRPLGAVRLLACDEGVAVMVDTRGRGRVFGPPSGGAAAFLFRPSERPDRCIDDASLDWRAGVPFVRVEGTPLGDAWIDLAAPLPTGAARATVTDGVVTVVP